MELECNQQFSISRSGAGNQLNLFLLRLNAQGNEAVAMKQKLMAEIESLTKRLMETENRLKVWTLTQFISVSFLWKIIDLPGGQINGFSQKANRNRLS